MAFQLFLAGHLHGHFHELFLNTPLGSYMAEKVNEKLKKEFFERYLQDFVCMTMKMASDEELQVRINKMLHTPVHSNTAINIPLLQNLADLAEYL